MSFPKPPLPPQPRPHALAQLEEEIVRAEATCARMAERIGTLDAAGQTSRWARGLLHIAEERLARLNRSREVLLRGEEGHEDDEPA
jgi:hypothetical protein